MLQCWRDVTLREYPDFVDLLPSPDDIDINKLIGGGIMTDTCSTAQLTNSLLSKEIDGKTHNLLCHNHLRNVWVKNVLESLTDFLRAHLSDSLDEIAPEFRVSPSFISFARAFDKMFSLCANYPKGWGDVFRQWMIENHPGELLFHVERAVSGGRQDIASMAAMAIYWNRNYCVEFLEEMRVHCGREENILANNLWTLLISVEMISVARMWSIFHISIVMPMRWLAGKTHTLKEYKWGYISMGQVLDKLKTDLESIVEQPELIHDESFMMGMMSKWADELPPLKDYLTRKFEEEKTNFVPSSSASSSTTVAEASSSATKAVPLKELRKELFHPTDQDNKDSTPMLEKLAAVAAQAWIDELVDPTKGTFRFLSESEGEYSYDHSSAELKEALFGMTAVNDLAESSFAGVTAQVQVYGRIGMANAAAISDMARNGFMHRPTTAEEMRSATGHGLFHGLPEELQITAVMTAMEQAPATRDSNNRAMELQRETKRMRDQLVKEEGLEKAHGEYIECLIYHRMFNSDRLWKTAKDVRDGVKALQYKKDKEEGLKDNILMRFKGMGWVDAQTTWSKDGKKKTIPQLQQRLIEIIALTRGFEIRDKPPTKVPQRKQTAILGTLTNKVREMDAERVATEEEFDLKARHLWRERNDKGEGSVHQSCQLIGNRKLDASFLNTRIEVLTSFDIVGDDGKKTTQLRWCGGVVEKISDGTWLYPNARTRCYKENDAAFIYWDPVEECDFPASRSIQELKENKWNKDCVGAWRKDLGDETYGL